MTIFLIICIVTMFGCSTSREARKTAELAKAEAAIEELRVGMAGLDIKTACIIIAQQLGYFDEEGVSVKFETISNLADGLTAVEQGKLDILPFGVIPSCTFIAQGSDLYVFGGTISEGSEIIVTAENATRIKSAEDFIGKKIGCFRMETGHMVVKGYLRKPVLTLVRMWSSFTLILKTPLWKLSKKVK